MKVLNEYATHHYIDEYEKCPLHCPNCGVQSVWEEQSEGDYYAGPEFICITCSHNFTIQGPTPSNTVNETKKIEQIKSGTTFIPNTPRGN
jgi:hypothetical protein